MGIPRISLPDDTMKLPPRQAACLREFERHLSAHGEPPTREELGRALGVSKVSAHHLVVRLEEKGMIRRSRNVRRGLERASLPKATVGAVRLPQKTIAALAVQAGWLDAPTVHMAFGRFRLGDFANAVAASAVGEYTRKICDDAIQLLPWSSSDAAPQPCACCGGPPELWEIVRGGVAAKMVNCGRSVVDPDRGEPCPMYFTSSAFCFPTRRGAIRYWNAFQKTLTEKRGSPL